MQSRQVALDGYIEALKKEEIDIDYLRDNEDLSQTDLRYIISNYEIFLKNSGVVLDVIDKPQTNIFTWGCVGADRVFTPIEKHHFILLVGSAGTGKTAFTFDFALKNASLGNRVLYISLEMSSDNIITRIARDYAGIGKWEWRDRKKISAIQSTAYKNKKQELLTTPNFEAIGFSEGNDPSLKNLFKVILEKSPDMVIIDNFNLVSKERGIDDIQQDHLVSSGFMNFAKKNNIATVVVHHLNKTKGIRGSEKIKDNSCGVFSCYRETTDYDKLDDIDKSAFVLTELKDREFGRPSTYTFYFHKGTFYGEYQGR